MVNCPKCGKRIIKVYGKIRYGKILGGETAVSEGYLECPCGYSSESLGSTEE